MNPFGVVHKAGPSHAERRKAWRESGAQPRAASTAPSSVPRPAPPRLTLKRAAGIKSSPQARRARWEEKGSPRVGAFREPPKPRTAAASTGKYASTTSQKARAGVSGSGALLAAGVLASRKNERRQGHNPGSKHVDEALGAGIGAGAVDAAMTSGGAQAKHTLTRRRESSMSRMNWDQKQAHNARWQSHLESHGVKRLEGASNATKIKVMSSYPKGLPGWRAQRALAFKNRPTVVAGALLTGAAVGARAAHGKVEKSFGRGEERW